MAEYGERTVSVGSSGEANRSTLRASAHGEVN